MLTPSLLERHFSPTKANAAWAAGPTSHRELVLNALASAVKQRRPRGTIIHSDQGVPFGSDAWRRFCRANHLEPSMSRKGNGRDNAVAASFFNSLKKERIKQRIYPNRDVALKVFTCPGRRRIFRRRSATLRAK